MAATNYSKDKVMKDVRVVLDQNESSTPLSSIGDIDQLQTDDIIEKCMSFALDRIVASAPAVLLDGMSEVIDVSTLKHSSRNGRYYKMTSVPLRLISVMCSDWMQAVYDFITPLDDEYRMQKSPLAGVRGSVDRPVVALVPDPETDGAVLLEIYDSDSASATIRYISHADTKPDGSVSLNPLLYQAYIYMVASLYYDTLLQPEPSAEMEKRSVQSMGLTNKI